MGRRYILFVKNREEHATPMVPEMRTKRRQSIPAIRPVVWLAAILMAVLLIPQQSNSADQRLPVKVRLAILLKVLTYVAQETVKEIKNNRGKKVGGLSIWVESLEIVAPETVTKTMAEKNLNLLYLCPNLGQLVNPILRYAKSQKVLVITGEAKHVQDGAAVGAVLRGQKPKILINLKAAAEQGANFDARVLRLAEIIR
jgi:hypothetical protein